MIEPTRTGEPMRLDKGASLEFLSVDKSPLKVEVDGIKALLVDIDDYRATLVFRAYGRPVMGYLDLVKYKMMDQKIIVLDSIKKYGKQGFVERFPEHVLDVGLRQYGL